MTITTDSIKVTSNYRERRLLSPLELPAEMFTESGDFWYAREVRDDLKGYDEGSRPRFFKFRGSWYDVDEFAPVRREILVTDGDWGPANPIAKWDGAQSQSYFDAVLVRYPRTDTGEIDNLDFVVVGYAHW